MQYIPETYQEEQQLKIKQLLKDKNITPAELADKCNKSVSTIWGNMNGSAKPNGFLVFAAEIHLEIKQKLESYIETAEEFEQAGLKSPETIKELKGLYKLLVH